MNPRLAQARDDQPFMGMEISDTSVLNTLEGRSSCPKCYKSRKYFCYTCYVPIREFENYIPIIKLPIKIDIIKHRNEIDGKSTAIHAAVLAPGDVTIYTYPDIPDYSQQEDTVLIFPSMNSIDIPSLFNHSVAKSDLYKEKAQSELPYGYNLGTLMTKIYINETVNYFNVTKLPIKKAVFIDSTWSQCRGIYKDDRLKRIPSVVIQKRASQFWRHQKGSPRWYLATVEAIHQFLLELHLNAWGVDERYEGPYCDGYQIVSPEKCQNGYAPYNGQYDNLLFLFRHMYEKIHSYYSHDQLQSYRRPMV